MASYQHGWRYLDCILSSYRRDTVLFFVCPSYEDPLIFYVPEIPEIRVTGEDGTPALSRKGRCLRSRRAAGGCMVSRLLQQRQTRLHVIWTGVLQKLGWRVYKSPCNCTEPFLQALNDYLYKSMSSCSHPKQNGASGSSDPFRCFLGGVQQVIEMSCLRKGQASISLNL